VDGKGGKFGASLYTSRLISFARIEPMLNPILVGPTTLGFTLYKEFISPPFTPKKKQTKQINTPRGQNGHCHCPFPCFIFHFIFYLFFINCVLPQFSPTLIPHFHQHKYLFRQVINFNLMQYVLP
jgi:hypothetical protein